MDLLAWTTILMKTIRKQFVNQKHFISLNGKNDVFDKISGFARTAF